MIKRRGLLAGVLAYLAGRGVVGASMVQPPTPPAPSPSRVVSTMSLPDGMVLEWDGPVSLLRVRGEKKTDFWAVSRRLKVPHPDDVVVMLNGEEVDEWIEANAALGVVALYQYVGPPKHTVIDVPTWWVSHQVIREGRVEIRFRDDDARRRHIAAHGRKGMV